MLIESILGYKASFRILSFLSETPKKLISRGDIKKYTYLGNEAINTALKRLTLSNILIKEKSKKKEFYYYNLENVFTNEILNILKLENKGLRFLDYKIKIILNEFTRKMIEKIPHVLHSSVFGSYSKGTQKNNSDIDIAIIFDKKDIKSELLITSIVEKIQEQFKIKLEIHYILKEDYIKTNSILIEEIKDDEIILFSVL